ncbi:dihydrolipoamide acetyltransferase family protein [Bacillus sp. V3-13]|uniref:dihydrolipoamide acetyltransferase family protein n=1 Tax=Bacillus sp. V3-13 TaxID=2053728 RepID=UPI0015E13BAB|nr:dihydrolipoamide acetyltransferase family protein [Bacillus sp. V3-13]
MIQLPKKSFIASPRARAKSKKLSIDLNEVTGSGPSGRIIEEDVIFFYNNTDSEGLSPTVENRKITPLAKKIAIVENLDLNAMQGSVINGKITSKVIRDALNRKNSTQYKVTDTFPLEVNKKPLTGIRRTIANRMSASKRDIPHVTLTVKTEATQLVKYRSEINEQLNGRVKVSFTDLLVKIAAECLRQNPLINISLIDNEIIYHNDINVGIAVALDEGLVVPVVKSPDKMSIEDIALDRRDIVSKARNGKLKPSHLQNGRFTISNLGMYEVDAFTPIINPPETAILGVGRIIDDVIVENGTLRFGKTLVLSLSFDHRVIDGAPAASFLEKVKRLIEDPVKIENTV